MQYNKKAPLLLLRPFLAAKKGRGKQRGNGRRHALFSHIYRDGQRSQQRKLFKEVIEAKSPKVKNTTRQ